MSNHINYKQHGTFTHKNKIYVWGFDTDSGKLVVKNAGEDLFSVKPYLENIRDRITNDYVKDKLENFLKFGTPTPDISKSEPYDGIDFVPED